MTMLKKPGGGPKRWLRVGAAVASDGGARSPKAWLSGVSDEMKAGARSQMGAVTASQLQRGGTQKKTASIDV